MNEAPVSTREFSDNSVDNSAESASRIHPVYFSDHRTAKFAATLWTLSFVSLWLRYLSFQHLMTIVQNTLFALPYPEIRYRIYFGIVGTFNGSAASMRLSRSSDIETMHLQKSDAISVVS